MSLTRTQAETILISRTEPLMLKVSFSNAPGNNPDLNDPIGWALLKLGIALTDLSIISDADVAALSSSQLSAFLDLAELRLLQSIYQSYMLVDVTVGPRSSQYNQIAERIAKAVETKKAQVVGEYGIGLGELSAGTISLDFMTKGDDSEYILGG